MIKQSTMFEFGMLFLVYICAYLQSDITHPPYRFGLQKCKRKIIGRILCEFENTPVIKIKGL